MLLQEGDHLLRRDAVLESVADGVAGDDADGEVGQPACHAHKQAQQRDLQGRRRVRVHPVVALHHDVPRPAPAGEREARWRRGGSGGGGGGGCGGGGGGDVGGVGHSGGEVDGEACWVEPRRRRLLLIDEAKLAEIGEEDALRLGEVLHRIVMAEFKKAELEEERQHLVAVHAPLLGGVDVLEDEGPDLGVDVLEEELEPVIRNLPRVLTLLLHQFCANQKVNDSLRWRLLIGPGVSDHKVEYGLPRRLRVLVQLFHGRPVLVRRQLLRPASPSGTIAKSLSKLLFKVAVEPVHNFVLFLFFGLLGGTG
mmetsp:Transcript_25700/g.44253  ORF Transcript_25700/g.44253 Transcript_25700/m.44253 type:complete len:309 (+) Transcript_25700:359-1285(+)